MNYFQLRALLALLLFSPMVVHADPLVSCIDDSGNTTSSANTCNAILPKCSDLKATYEKAVKNFLTWKIWGYYQGKNIDIDASTLTSASPTLVGTNLLYPICSIVGHKMQYTGTPPLTSGYNACDKTRQAQANAFSAAGIEYASQTIANKASCGLRPNTATSGNNLKIQFSNGGGNLWASYFVGAYPWLIRRYASDVLSQIKPDLSNLSDVISDSSSKSELSSANTSAATYYGALSTESKTLCSGAGANIVSNCSSGNVTLSDPSNKICTLVKAQATTNTGALPNVIVKEIMLRVQTQYDALFDKLLAFNVPDTQNIWNKCKDTGSLFRSGTKKTAMTASCLFDGAEFYTYSSNNFTTENGCTGSASHRGTYPVAIRIADGAAVDMGNPAMGPDRTLTLGFAAVIESIIRRDICLQTKYTDASVCDSINIPDQPAGVQ
jgi:hypothetical protein